MREILFLLCVCFAQLGVSCDELKPSIVFVTQKDCGPCKPAKALIDKLEREQVFVDFNVVELDLVKDRDKLTKYNFPVSRTPTVFVANAQNEVTTTIPTIDESHLRAISEMVPVACVEPVKLAFDEPIAMQASDVVGAPGDIVITWDLATMYRTGDYQGTFAFAEIEYALNSLGRYKKVQFKRVTRGGQYHVIQANYQLKANPYAAEWTTGNTTYVSPVFRFSSTTQCNMCSVHEYLHTSGVNSNKGGHHAQDGGIMGPSGGYLINANDWPYMQRFPWRSALRPTSEPNWFKAYLSKNAVLGGDDASQFPLLDKQGK